MKKMRLFSSALLGLVVVQAGVSSVGAKDIDSKTTTGNVVLKADDTTVVFPVDPKDPSVIDKATGDKNPNPLPPGVILVPPTDPNVKPGTDLTPGSQVDPLYPAIVTPVTAGSLGISLRPDGFTFGTHKLSSADKQKTKVTFTQEVATDRKAKYDKQVFEVFDGRPDERGFTLSATLSGFDDLTGAEIELADKDVANTAYDGKVTEFHGFGNLAVGVKKAMIVNDGKGTNPANGGVSLLWDYENVKLNIPGKSLNTKQHDATITWSLTDEPAK